MITVFLTSVFFKPFLTVAGKCVQPKTLRRSSGGEGWFSFVLYHHFHAGFGGGDHIQLGASFGNLKKSTCPSPNKMLFRN